MGTGCERLDLRIVLCPMHCLARERHNHTVISIRSNKTVQKYMDRISFEHTCVCVLTLIEECCESLQVASLRDHTATRSGRFQGFKSRKHNLWRGPWILA